MSPLMNLFILGIATMFALPSSWCRLPPQDFHQKYMFPTKFSTKLFLEVVKTQNRKNTVMSPLSVQIALSILYVGAAGDTRSEMSKAFGITEKSNNIYLDSLGSLITFARRNRFLKIASTVFISKTLKIFGGYQKAIRKFFDSNVQPLDFADGSKSAKTVNTWCSKNTNGMIKELVEERDFTPKLSAMIVNAIHFKAKWRTPFDKHYTKTKDFSTVGDSGSTSKVQVKMMNLEDYFPFNDNHEQLKAQIIALPYDTKPHRFEMVIILPKEVDGIKNTLNELNKLGLESVLNSLYSGLVDVKLPKFKQEVSLDLVNGLKKVGLSDIFPPKANFKKLSKSNLYVSKVLQKAVISVAENGTEAAAATVVAIPYSASMNPHKVYKFTADHPFIYLIMLKGTAIPLFQGVVMKPEFKD